MEPICNHYIKFNSEVSIVGYLKDGYRCVESDRPNSFGVGDYAWVSQCDGSWVQLKSVLDASWSVCEIPLSLIEESCTVITSADVMGYVKWEE